MIQYSSAVKIVKKEFLKLKFITEKVNLLNSPGRILAEDIYADTPQPLFTNSAMDGYAIKFKKGITKWKVIGEISSGKYKNYKPAIGETVMIMTGSKMPEYADTVIPIEHIVVKGNEIILINGKELIKFQHVRHMGEDVKKGTKVLFKGQLIRPNHIQLAASCGKKTVNVYGKLKIGVITTGNELIDIGHKPKDDKIRASNLFTLLALADENSFQPLDFGVLKDEKYKLKQKINKSLQKNLDILITSGGVSEGKYDFLHEVYKFLGVKILFHKVNIKPGKPMLFGIYKKKGRCTLVFGLPGNPVSCFVNFHLFIRNIYYSEKLNYSQFNTNAVLVKDIIKKDSKRHFIRGNLIETGGVNYVSASVNQSSANSLGLSNSNVLIEFPENEQELKSGCVVKCIKI